MRILDVKTIKHIEKEAIAIGLNSWEGLMESAAFAFSKHFVKYYLKPNHQTIFILIGPGNNGGDGIIIAQILNILTKLKINALLIDTFQKQSQLQKAVLKRILLNRNIDIYSVDNQSSLPEINENDVIIDSIFGYGLNRSVKGELIPLFQHINFSKATKVSVDMPSGMLSDSINETEVTIINSDHIITFHSPKLSLFYPENHHLMNITSIVDIGLPNNSIVKNNSIPEFITDAHELIDLKSRALNTYKSKQGKVFIVGGCKNMHGAPLLSSQAALNTGCGYSYVISAEYVVNKLTNPSILTIETNSGEHVSDLTFLSGTTIAIGPGLGLNHDTIVALGKFLLNRKLPIIIDADALTIIADNKWHDRIPPNSILTPHEGEFKKLIGTNYNNGNERLRLLMNYAKKYQCVVVLKGPYTCIATPDGKIYFNSTGNSALAVAGSGDVLTGMIASFHAQGYTMAESAIKGVFYHGLAADLYVQEYDEYSLTPITLISWIKHALAKSQTE